MSLEHCVSRASSELKNEIVRAGAGAGKTTRLVSTVLDTAMRFLSQDERLPKIVVTTFTRKATQELRERLVREACQRAEPRLIEFVSSHAYLHISTIHGVLSIFLRRYGHLFDLDPGFSFLEPAASERLARKVLRDCVLREERFQDLLEDFSFDDLVAMVGDYLEARAGGPAPDFYDESSLERLMRERLAEYGQRLKTVAQMIGVETAKSEPWQEYVRHLKLSAQRLVLKAPGVGGEFNGADWLEFLALVKKPRFVEKTAPFSVGLHEDLKQVLKDCEDLEAKSFDLQTLKEYARKSGVFGDLASLFADEMQKAKLAQGLLDMSDLERLCAKATREHPEIASAFSAEWDYWLIDEFQDTSPRQVELLRQLVGDRKVFLVGDPQQSIYLFRGARSEVFAAEEDQFRDRGDTLSELKTNYRSAPGLLLFLNDFFTQVSRQTGAPFMVMQPKGPVANPSAVVAKFQIVSKEVERPYASLARDLLAHVNTGGKFDDFCVLGRTNSELRPIARYFEQRRIPTHIHASAGFFRRREVLDALSILKFLMNPLDNMNFIRLVRSPWFKISDQELVNTLKDRPAYGWAATRVALEGHEAVVRLEAALSQVEEVGYVEMLRRLLVEVGVLDTSHFHDSTGRRESNIWKLLAILQKNEKTPGFSLMSFVQKALRGFRSNDGDEESDAVAALEPNRVNFMTVHKAKGLKFKHVIVPNMGKRMTASESRGHKQLFVMNETDQRFTLALKLGDERKITHNLAAEKHFGEISERERAEYWRLLYVAMTRAEESVTLHWQEPTAAGSWAGQLAWDLEEKLHQRENYAYFVERDAEDELIAATETLSPPPVRLSWKEAAGFASTESKRKISVTRLLEESTEAEALQPAAGEAETAGKENDREKDKSKLTEIETQKLMRGLELPVLGQKLHLVLERMKYGGALDLKSYGARWFGERTAEFQAAVDYTLQLREPPIEKLIRSGEVEWGFQLRTARGILEGQIDLWGIIADTEGNAGGTAPGHAGNRGGAAPLNKPVTWVVDYKSGSSRSSVKALDQLSLYAHALRENGITGEIRLAVVYSIEKKCVVRPAPSSADVKSRFGL